MKKLLAISSLAIVLCFLVASPVHAENPYQDISDSFFTGLDTGDYSNIEPYLSSEMKEAFDRTQFNSFRNNLISDYGQLDNYRFVGEEQDQYTKAYYEASFDEAVLTIRLVFGETGENYELAGVQITNVESGDGDSGNIISRLPTFAFPLAGAILAFLLFYLIGFKNIKLPEISIGLFLAFITILVQPTIQNLLFIVLGIKSNAAIVAKGVFFTVLSSVYLGFIAGVFQEGIKYPLSRKRTVKTAAFIGLGFGLGEAVILPIISVLQGGALITSLPTSWAVLNLFERFLATVFHGCTTAIMAYAYSRGWGLKALATLVVAHGGIDAFAVFYQLTGSQMSLVLSLASVAIISAILFYFVLEQKGGSKQPETEGNNKTP